MLNNEYFRTNFNANNLPKVVILTGAGISAESGIKTFRDNNGLWENHSVEEVATPEGFAQNPDLVYRFYNERRQQLLSPNVQANLAHKALAELESVLNEKLSIVTQNVDNLHESAGSLNVLHMHGALLWAKCVESQKRIEIKTDITGSTLCSCCSPSQALRPDIVWFGEIPYYMEQIQQHLSQADLFVSIGTSGNVYPAAGFANFAQQNGAYTLELNLEQSNGNSNFDESHFGVASKLVPEFVDTLFKLINN